LIDPEKEMNHRDTEKTKTEKTNENRRTKNEEGRITIGDGGCP
jgi:hypothetical protein